VRSQTAQLFVLATERSFLYFSWARLFGSFFIFNAPLWGARLFARPTAAVLVPILNELSFADYLEPFDKFSDSLSRGCLRMA
jgi:hypothetical protein